MRVGAAGGRGSAERCWRCCHSPFTIAALLRLQPVSDYCCSRLFTGARSLSWDRFAGGEVVRSGPLAEKPRKHLSPPNPCHVQPPAALGVERRMQPGVMPAAVLCVLSYRCPRTPLKSQEAEVTPSDGDPALPAAPAVREGVSPPPHGDPAPKG